MLEMPMHYLGLDKRVSKKTGKEYALAKFQKDGGTEVFNFYVGNDDLRQEVGVLQQFKKYDLRLDLTSFKGDAKVDLIGIGGKTS
jgi:hypothetical protein